VNKAPRNSVPRPGPTRQAPCAPSGRRPGFTLIELLTVIMIITMLVGIALPSLLELRKQFMRTESLSYIRQIQGGIGLYYADFGPKDPNSTQGYPPSSASVAGSAFSGWQGREILCFLLLGYADDAGNDGGPNLSNFTQDDGFNGPGFRLAQGGQVYGPYVSERLPRRYETEHSRSRFVFVDAFDNPFHYYLSIPYSVPPQYSSGDDDYGPGTGGKGSFDKYAKKPPGFTEFYRRDFILCSPGPDHEWGFKTDGNPDPTSDDITNFLKEAN